MIKRCPHCGQPLPEKLITTADQLVAVMRVPPPPQPAGTGKNWKRGKSRDVYEGTDRADLKRGSGRYFITYGGGEVARAAIDEALALGLIVQKFDCDGYWSLA